MPTFILIKNVFEKFNPKLCNDKNTKHFPSIQIYTKNYTKEEKKPTIKQPPLNLVK